MARGRGFQLLTADHQVAIRDLLNTTAALRSAADLLDWCEPDERADRSRDVVLSYVAMLQDMEALLAQCPLTDPEGRLRRSPVQWAIDQAGRAGNEADDHYRAANHRGIPAWFTNGMTPPPGYTEVGGVTLPIDL